MSVLHKLYQAVHKLSTPTVVLWTIVQIDQQRLDVGKAFFDALPPANQTIHQTITGDFGCHPIQKKLIRGGKENPHWCHCGFGLEIMVSGLGWDTTLASSCKRADLDRGFGIH